MKPLPTISIRFWLPAFVMGAFALLFLVSSLWRSGHEVRKAENNAKFIVAFFMAAEKYRIEQMLHLGANRLLSGEAAYFSTMPTVTFFALVNNQSQVLNASQPDLVGRPIDWSKIGFDEGQSLLVQRENHLHIDLDVSGNSLLAYQSVLLDVSTSHSRSNSLGVLLLKYSLVEAKAQIRKNIWNDLLINFGITLAIAFGLIFWVRRWFTQPLTALQEVVNRMGEGDFTWQLNLSGDGELAQLGKDIKRMQQARLNAEAALHDSEKRFRDTFRLMPASLVLQTEQGVVLDCSDDFCQSTGFQREEIIDRTIVELNLWAQPEQRVVMRGGLLREGKVDGFEFELRHRNGSTSMMQMSVRQLVIGGERLLLSFSHDISARKKAEMERTIIEAHLNEAQRIAHLGSWQLDLLSGQIVWSNELYLMYEADPNLPPPPYSESAKLFTPESWTRLSGAIEHSSVTADPYELELETVKKDGRKGWMYARGEAVQNTDGVTVSLRGVAYDITARKQAELALAHQAELLDLTGELAQIGGWEVNLQTMKLTWTRETFRIAEIETGVEPPLEEGINLFAPEARPIIAAAVQATIDTGVSYDLELPLITAKGNSIWVKTQGFAEMKNGQAVRIYGTFQDVTARKSVDTELLNALNEKTALLKEVHHRVKNNLQVITSLLSLESVRSPELATKNVLKDMKDRIRSMALLHETLYRTGIFASVELGDYLKQLATQVFRANATSAIPVSLTCEFEPLSLEMDQALPCGLIINELISNSLKHGFTLGSKGHINVTLKVINCMVQLTVSDTGVGLAQDFELQKAASLGLHLVSDLAKQLGGKLEIQTGQGAVFTVSFSLKPQNDS